MLITGMRGTDPGDRDDSYLLGYPASPESQEEDSFGEEGDEDEEEDDEEDECLRIDEESETDSDNEEEAGWDETMVDETMEDQSEIFDEVIDMGHLEYAGHGLSYGDGEGNMEAMLPYPLDTSTSIRETGQAEDATAARESCEEQPCGAGAMLAAELERALEYRLSGGGGGGGGGDDGSDGSDNYDDDDAMDEDEYPEDDEDEEDEDDDDADGDVDMDDAGYDSFDDVDPADIFADYVGDYDPFAHTAGNTLDFINARDVVRPLTFPACPRGGEGGAGSRVARCLTMVSSNNVAEVVEAFGMMSFEKRLSDCFSDAQFTPLARALRLRAAAWDPSLAAALGNPHPSGPVINRNAYESDDDYLFDGGSGDERDGMIARGGRRPAVMNRNATPLPAYQRMQVIARGSGQVSATRLAGNQNRRIVPIDIPLAVEEAQSFIAEWDSEPFDPSHCPFCQYASTYGPSCDNNSSVNAFVLSASIAISTTDVRIRCRELAIRWNKDREGEGLPPSELSKRLVTSGHVYMHFYARGSCVKWAVCEIQHSITLLDHIIDALTRNVLSQVIDGPAVSGPPVVNLSVSNALVRYSAERVKMLDLAAKAADSTNTQLLLVTALASKRRTTKELQKRSTVGMTRTTQILRATIFDELVND